VVIDREGEREKNGLNYRSGEWLGRDFNIEIAAIARLTDDEKLQSPASVF